MVQGWWGRVTGVGCVVLLSSILCLLMVPGPVWAKSIGGAIERQEFEPGDRSGRGDFVNGHDAATGDDVDAGETDGGGDFEDADATDREVEPTDADRGSGVSDRSSSLPSKKVLNTIQEPAVSRRPPR